MGLRLRLVLILVTALLVGGVSTPAVQAGCGCQKPPPTLAAIRPAFASPGADISLFAPELVDGTTYSVTFGDVSAGGITVSATAVLRRDFADAVPKPQVVVAAPELPPGPTSVTVTLDDRAVLGVPASDFTMLPPAIPLEEVNGETIATCYRAAVGADNTLYLPLDISAIGQRMMFTGAARGYRYTYAAEDIAIYNNQGVLMQLLGPAQAGIYTITDDAIEPLRARATVPGEANTEAAPVTLSFDPDPEVDLTENFAPPLRNLDASLDVGTGLQPSGGVVFDPYFDGTGGGTIAEGPNGGRTFAPYIYSTGGFQKAGVFVRSSVDVRFTSPFSRAMGEVSVYAGGGQMAFLRLTSDGHGLLTATMHNGSWDDSAIVGSSAATTYTSNWLRLELRLEHPGPHFAYTATVSDLGPDGAGAPTRVLELAGTFSDDGMAGNPGIIRGFGARSPEGLPEDALYFDNFTDEYGTLPAPPTPEDPAPGDDGDGGNGSDGGAGADGGDDTGGDGGVSDDEDDVDGAVDEEVKSFRLTYDRHEFQTYRVLHATNPSYFLDPSDRAWHRDGTRHIDHDQLIVAIRGKVNDVLPPPPGQTPPFNLYLRTELADAPDAPAAPLRILRGNCNRDDANALCRPLPQTGCHQPAKPEAARLSLKNKRTDRADALVWKWAKGDTTTLADFGAPERNDSAALCVYDESAETPLLIFRAAAPAGSTCPGRRHEQPCWRSLGKNAAPRGYKYADGDRTPDGISSLVLRPGAAGKASITVKGKGSHLDLPALPLPTPARVQLQAENGQCWEARYLPEGVKKNTKQIFKAKASE
jgi:hypothetical protein